MDHEVVLAQAGDGVEAFLSHPDHGGGIRHVVVREGGRILEVVRVNTALRHASAEAGIAMRDIGSPNFKVDKVSVMFKTLQSLPILLLILIATTLEVSGDATVRLAIYEHAGFIRFGLFLAGAALLLGYGSFLNTAPVEFGRIVGLYIATLFIVWQIINFLVFRTIPGPPVFMGGALIIAGGIVITFWRPT